MTLPRRREPARAFDRPSHSYDLLATVDPGYRTRPRGPAHRLRHPRGGAGPRVPGLGCGTGASTRALLRAVPPAPTTALGSGGAFWRAKALTS